MRVQLAVERLMPRVQADPAFGGAWYEHAPCYRIVFAFKDGRPRQWVVDSAEPALRPYIAFAGSKYSEAEREQARLEIGAALAAAGVRSMFVSSINPDRFTIVVGTATDAQIATQQIPPRYRPDTSISVGQIEPMPERDSPAAAEVLQQPQLTSNQVAELQLQVIPLNQAVRRLPGFSELYIEHEPTWHVVVSFAEPVPPRGQIAALAPPAIRDRILVRPAKRTAAQIAAANEAIVAALNRTGIEYTGGYSPKTERFTVTVGSPEHVQPMLAAVPSEYRGDTDVVVGLLPVPE